MTMLWMGYVLWIFLIPCYVDSAVPGEDAWDLIQINVVWRHGARTPSVTPFPTSSFPKSTVPLQLTTTGMMQLYKLGKSLKGRYISGDPFNLLSSSYDSSQILVNSSILSRTMKSAYCLLAGMFPPEGDQIWNPHLLWQPIPVYTLDPWEDPACNILDESTCPVILKLRTHEAHSEKARKITEENKEFFKYLDEQTGYAPGTTNISVVYNIHDILVMEEEEGILSDWANHNWTDDITVMEKMDTIILPAFEATYIDGDLKKVMAGNLLGKIINNMKDPDERTIRAFLFSGHEEKIGPLLACFDLFNSYINTGSVMIFELYKRNEKYGVKLAYKDGHEDTYQYFKIPGCDTSDLCPLDDFERIGEPCIPGDWKMMCGISPTSSQSHHSHKTSSTSSSRAFATGIVGSVVLICIVFGFVVIYTVVFRNKQKSNPEYSFHALN